MAKQKQNKQQNIAVHQAHYSGPIPPAQELANYENIVPGAAERILQMAEKSQLHQSEMEKACITAKDGEVKRGQRFAFMVTLGAFIVSGIAMFLGYPYAASAIAVATITGLAVAFVKGR